jgi:hypothetical protein
VTTEASGSPPLQLVVASLAGAALPVLVTFGILAYNLGIWKAVIVAALQVVTASFGSTLRDARAAAVWGFVTAGILFFLGLAAILVVCAIVCS